MTTGADVAGTRLRTEDERAWGRQQRRKRRKAKPPSVPDGPCCLRCRHWRAPSAHDDLGGCRLLAVVIERQPLGPEKGTVIAVEDALRDNLAWDYLHTTADYACSGYAEGSPADESLAQSPGLVEQVRMWRP